MEQLSNLATSLYKSGVGRRLNPQKPHNPPFFEGWYTRVIGPKHSFGIVTGYFPDQAPKHSAAYTAILVNDDSKSCQLQTFESYLEAGRAPDMTVERGDTGHDQRTDFLFQHPPDGSTIRIRGSEADLLYEAHADGASAAFKSLSGSTSWLDGGGGSPQGLLHLIPGLGLHWYVHSTLTRVAYDISLPGDQGRLKGEGWAHVEKNWGGSFPRSFIWSQGFSTSTPQSTEAEGNTRNGSSGASSNGDGNGNGNGSSKGNGNNDCANQPQATFCLAGGVLPTFNMDKLPVPLPNALLLGYHSNKLNWHFKPHNPTLFNNTIQPEEGLLIIEAHQLTRKLVLKVKAGLDTFSRVGGPTRAGFVPHSVESYSAKATAECYQDGQLIEVAHFDRAALEFGGSYACRAEEGAGRSTDGLVCQPQWED